MLLNLHCYYSLRYGTFPLESLPATLAQLGYDAAVITDINNSTAVLEFIRLCRQHDIRGYAGMEFRRDDELLYFGIAKNNDGFAELNESITRSNIDGTPLPDRAPAYSNVFVVYPFGSVETGALRENEFIGVRPRQLTRIRRCSGADMSRFVVWQPATFSDDAGYAIHRRLRAIDHNLLLSQLRPDQCAAPDDRLIPQAELLAKYRDFPQIVRNTEWLLSECCLVFDYNSKKNRTTFTGNASDDKQLLQTLAFQGVTQRYGSNHAIARRRVAEELAIIDVMGYAAYFLTTWDIINFSRGLGIYHVGRGSGANSVVAYCLHITDVCPIELDLYFERFINPKRSSAPDFDIDYSWKDRDRIYDYVFNRFRTGHTALLGAMHTFRDQSSIRELAKVYGLPKSETDRLIDDPDSVMNQNEVVKLIRGTVEQIADFPNMRSIHAGGILISERPLNNYVALDLPPKGYPVVQFDMYTAEAIGFDKLDILSQRGLGHIQECVDIVRGNRNQRVDIHAVESFKNDPKVAAQLKSGDTIGCFYIESPAMRGLLKKLQCSDYITLVAASSIIRPGVAKSGMMRTYIERFHHPERIHYAHPIIEQQLKETYGVMVYQEDVLKIGHHYGGLDKADADVLRRLMSGKNRGKHHLVEIEQKFFENCEKSGHDPAVSREVWRQIESFAGYSFSKAHSASYAVESYQSLFLKSYFPHEFCVAVLNNFGGFYTTRLYVNEAQRSGAQVHLPCVNHSMHAASIRGVDIYLGFVHVQRLESRYQHGISLERDLHGAFRDMEDFVRRTAISLDQLIILIRVGAMRFMGRSKKTLLWEAHSLLGKQHCKTKPALLFETTATLPELPVLEDLPLEHAYDEVELLGFPLSVSMFDLVKSPYRGEAGAADLLQHEGKSIRMVGNYITAKNLRTVRGDPMKFGTFLDEHGAFFDTVHFPPSLRQYDFKGAGVYLIEGKVVSDFGFPSVEVSRMGKMPIHADPRA